MHGDLLLIVLVQLVVVLVLSRVMGWLANRVHQPQVVGEMLAGIMLGPSLFAWLAPGAFQSIFRPDLIPGSTITSDPTQYLAMLSNVGVIFFLFLVGLELDPKLIRGRGRAAIVISNISIIAPFMLGAALTLLLYPRVFQANPPIRFSSAAMFMGAAMSITAFPVLARILTERNLHKTKVGAISIACAAVDDATAWCMLAFVVAVARAAGLKPALLTATYSIIYVLVMFLVIRPFLQRLQRVYERRSRLSPNVVALIFLLILVSACITERIGIHALFGAFLMGAIMPKGTQFVRHLSEKIEDFTVVFLLPIFFAYTGLKTQIGLLNHVELWGLTLLVIAVACLGKFGGSALAARACGLQWRESAAIGILMNTRGLMELIILNVGRELGVITDAVFAMMIIMALVTTALTTPVLHWVFPRRMFEAETGVESREPAAERPFTILIPVADPLSGAALLKLGAAISGQPDHHRLLALHLRSPLERDAYRAGLDESLPLPAPAALVLEPLLDQARRERIKVEPISFISRDIPDGIASIVRARRADLLLMGFHRPVFGHAILGGTVHRVLAGAPADVAIFVPRGQPEPDPLPERILIPYLGSPHDRLALVLAGRIAGSTGAAITALHVVPPSRRSEEPALAAQAMVERTLERSGLIQQAQFKVLADYSPVDAILREATEHDLVIIGVAEEWGLESQLIGFRPQRIALESPTSLLIVRKFGREADLPAPMRPVATTTT